MEKINGSESPLKERLQLLAGQTDKQTPKYKVLDALLSSKSFNDEIGDYFYKSDILDTVTEANLIFFMQLVVENADVKWFWMIEESYHGNGLAFGRYCDLFKKYYDEGIQADKAYEKYQNCSSVSEMDAGFAILRNEKADEGRAGLAKMPSEPEQEERTEPESTPPELKSNLQQLPLDVLEEFGKMIKDFDSYRKFIDNLQEQNRAMTQCISEMRLDMKNLYAEVIQYKKESLEIEMKTKLEEHTLKDTELRLVIEEKKNKQLLESVERWHSINSRLRDENADKTKKYNGMRVKYLELETKNKKLLVQIEELKKQQEKGRMDVKSPTTPQEVKIEAPEVSVMPKPDKQPDIKKLDEDSGRTEINDEGTSYDKQTTDYSGDSMIPIVNGIACIKEKSSIFARLFSKYHEKKFMKKSLSEQEGSIFVKMMELKFDKDKVSLVKRMIHGDAKISAVELYKLVCKNPSVEELNLFCNSASVV